MCNFDPIGLISPTPARSRFLWKALTNFVDEDALVSNTLFGTEGKVCLNEKLHILMEEAAIKVFGGDIKAVHSGLRSAIKQAKDRKRSPISSI